MRRMGRLAPALAAVVALGAAEARAEPLDVDLTRLGPPDPAVWQTQFGVAPAQATVLAADAKQRFAVLSSEMALAMSSALLEPASTTGHSGFDLAAEGSYSGVHGATIGSAPGFGFTNRPWPTRSAVPGSLLTSGLHVRKALPFSVEMGARLLNVARTTTFAAQGEVKVALNEGFDYFPDVAVRAAYTRLFNQPQWNLAATDLDFMVSKRFGVSAVTSFTPYAAARFTFVSASTTRLQFAPAATATPAQLDAGVASFPGMSTGLYRTTLGVRMTADVVSLALEGTYFAGKTIGGSASPGPGDYPDVKLSSSFSAAFRFGWEF